MSHDSASRCIVSCAYSEGAGNEGRYHKYARRLGESLEQQGYVGGYRCWMDSFPPGSPTHRTTHYAFKFWAVKWALDQGYKRVMWLDAGAYATAPIAPVWDEIQRRGVYVVAGDEPLGEWISDQALAHFGVTRDQAMDLRLCGGAIVGLDYENVKARIFFQRWGELARTKLFITAHSRFAPDKMKSLWVSDHDESMIVSSDPRLKGHRADEACFALILREIGVDAVPLKEWNEVMRSGY